MKDRVAVKNSALIQVWHEMYEEASVVSQKLEVQRENCFKQEDAHMCGVFPRGM